MTSRWTTKSQSPKPTITQDFRTSHVKNIGARGRDAGVSPRRSGPRAPAPAAAHHSTFDRRRWHGRLHVCTARERVHYDLMQAFWIRADM